MNARRKAWLTLLESRAKKYVRRKDIGERVLSNPVPLEALSKIERDLKGIPHAIIGGHAVTIHGQPRLTSDVDVLIDPSHVDAAIEQLDGTIIKPLSIGGMAINSNGIDVDLVAPHKAWLSSAIAGANATKYGYIISKPYLVLTKLWSSRGEQDDTDVIGVIRNMNDEEITQTRKLIGRYLSNEVDDLEQFIKMKEII